MTRPPRLAARILGALLPDHVAEPLAGDLAELHARDVRTLGPLRASLRYWGRVSTLPYLRLGRAARRLRGGRWRRWARRPIGREEGTMKATMGTTVGAAWRELGVAGRTLARKPLFSGVVVATLAASLGAAVLLFSVLEGVLLRPLPYPEPDRLVNVHATNEAWRTNRNVMLRSSWDRYGTTLVQVEAMAGAGVLSAVGATIGDRAVIDQGGPAEERMIWRATAGVFEALGVEPVLGRLPSASEHADWAPVAVLSHALWTGRFGADPAVLDRTVDLDDEPYRVVGVMPPEFHFPYEEVAAWTPLTPSHLRNGRQWPSYQALGRLAPGTGIDEAARVLDGVNARLAEGDPSLEGIGIRVVSRLEEVVGDVRSGLALLFGTVVLVLLLACVNLANLFVARSSRRRGEMAVRASLGAGRRSLLWSLSAEVLVLCVAGGGLGVALAVGLIEPFVEALSASISTFPRTAGIRINPLVLGFGAAATFLTALGAALPAGLAYVRRAPASTLRGGGGLTTRGVRRTQRGLLLAETAVAVVLLAGAGLLARSFVEAMAVDPGYRAAGLVYADMDPGPNRYPGYGELDAYYDELRRRLAALPGVESATTTHSVPSSGGAILNLLRPTEAPEDEASMVSYSVGGPGFFRTLGLPLLRGRGFLPSDHRDAPDVAVVSAELGERLFGGEDPLGRSVTIGTGPRATAMEIVGIVGEARMGHVQHEEEPHLYRPLVQRPTRTRTVVLRGAGDPLALVEAVRRVAAEVDPGVRVDEVGTVEGFIARSLAHVRLRTTLMGALALLALALALVGVFGVAAHAVESRTREIGVRMALGSQAGAEVRRVVAGVALPAVPGTILGTLVAWLASGVMTDLVEAELLADPLSYAAAAALLVGAAAVAAWLAARRAARVDPARVLDGE